MHTKVKPISSVVLVKDRMLYHAQMIVVLVDALMMVLVIHSGI